jgi:hypothetical protein
MAEPVLEGRPGPMPFFLLLDEAMRRTRPHLRAVLPSVALPVALLTTLLSSLQMLNARQSLAQVDVVASLMSSLEVLVGSLLVGILTGVAYSAAQVAALDALMGRPVDMRRAWRFVLQARVWSALLLVGLALFVSAIACIVPVLYVAPLLSLVMPVMVVEEVFGVAALSRSAELTRFNPSRRLGESPILKVLLLMVASTLIAYLAALPVDLPFQLPVMIDILRRLVAGNLDTQALVSRWIWLQVPAVFLGSLVRTAVYLYTAFGIGMLFFDVRGRKEGTDLREEIDALFPAPPVPPSGAPWP